ncbi:MAG TPA: VWA domain-containing protein, partial [Bryobacteraceae bacterium]|nr:VWA domain-containing protein [Bryobacteraceae bacterium]
MLANWRSAALSLLVFAPLAAAFQGEGPILKPAPFKTLGAESRARADLRVDVPLVLIPAHVTTALGVSVTHLKAQDFHLFEDGVEQQITHLSNEDAPVSVGVLLDTSGSMRDKIRKSGEAAAAFFKTANPEDEFFLIEFNERPKLIAGFTRDSNEILKRIAHARTMGRTSLLDAIRLALDQMKDAQNPRKAVLILSDGGDNRSRYTESEIRSAMREADVQVYALGIFDPDGRPRRTPEERNGPRLLADLAEQSGGRHYPVGSLDDLPGLCERVGMELRDQ